NFNACDPEDVSCLCVYPYTTLSSRMRPNPNSCSQTRTCSGAPGSLVCQANTNCVAVDYFPCTISSQCASGSTCNSTSGGISILSFDYYQIVLETELVVLFNSTSPLYIVPSTTLYYKKYGSRTPEIALTIDIVISKLVGYSDSTRDYVY